MELTLPYPKTPKTTERSLNPTGPDLLARKTFFAVCHIGRDLSCSGDTHGSHNDFGHRSASWRRVRACSQGNQFGVTDFVRRGRRRRGVGCALDPCRLQGNLGSVLETPDPDGMPTVRRPCHVLKNGITIGTTNSSARSLWDLIV